MVIDVWASLVGDALPDHLDRAEVVVPDSFRTGCIAICGGQSLALFVDFARQTEEFLAGAMHDKLGKSLEAGELRDAVGEFVNILGGEIQRRLGPGYTLGLPVISRDRECPLRIPDTRTLCEIEYSPPGHTIRIVLAVIEPDEVASEG